MRRRKDHASRTTSGFGIGLDRKLGQKVSSKMMYGSVLRLHSLKALSCVVSSPPLVMVGSSCRSHRELKSAYVGACCNSQNCKSFARTESWPSYKLCFG